MAAEVPQTLEYKGGQLNAAPVLEDFQDSPDDEEDTSRSQEYIDVLEEEYQHKPELRPTKDVEAKYNKVKAKLALLSSSASASKALMVKNKSLIAESYECDKEEVSSDDNEMVKVKVLMALAEDNDDVNKEGARNGEWVKISMRKLHTLLEIEDNDDTKNYIDYLCIDLNYFEKQRNNLMSKHKDLVQEPNICKEQLLLLKQAKLDFLTMQHVNNESLVCSTPLPLLEKLGVAEPVSGPKTTKSILKSNYTFKADALKGIIINELSSAPSKGNRSASASKVNSAPTGKLNNYDEKGGTIFNSNKEVVMIAPRVIDVYVLDMTSSAQESCFYAKASENLNWLWHTRLAHLNFKTINKLAKKSCYWNKRDETRIVIKNKARHVAQGYNQQEGIDFDETFAPIIRLEAIKIFLACATYMNFIVYQIDVKSAFLNGKLKEEFYVKQPLGFESSEFPNHVVAPTTAKQRLAKKNELKAKGTLLMALLDKHKLKFNIHKDAKSLMEAIKKRSPRDTRNKDTQRGTVPVKTSTSNALVSQCDGVGSYDWSFQANEEPTNYALMAFTSSSSSSSDSEVALCSKACSESVEARLVVYQQNENVFEEDIKLLKLNDMLRDNALVEIRKKFETVKKERDELKHTLEKFQTSLKNLNVSVPTSQVHDRYKSSDRYHAVPPPYTGTFMPLKLDLVFHDAPTASKTVPTVFNVKPSTTKPTKETSQSNRPSAPIIEDWIFDSEDEYEGEPMPIQKEPSFVQTSKHVKTPRTSVKSVKHPKQAKNLRKDFPKSRANGPKPIRNHAMKVNHQNSARMTHPHSNKHVIPTAVLTRSRLIPLNAARPVTTAIPQTNVKHQRPTKHQALKDKGIIDSGCSRHMIRNISYLSDFEEINRGYAAFGGNPKGGKITGKDSFLPIPFWAEAVNTACYVQNKVLVTKPYNKTPYKLLLDRTPSIGFMRPFGCPVTIVNTLDPLGKFDRKADEGFLVGYSVSRKAFRVFNSTTRIVQETLHIKFIKNQPNVAGSGPKWLFDIDTLTQTMNYHPVIIGNQPNHNADSQNTDAAFDDKENESEVHVSPSSSDKPKKHDEKAKREAKEKSPVDLSIGVRDLSDEFEEFYINSTNRFTAAIQNFKLVKKSSFVDPSQYPDDPDMPALEDIVYSDDEEDVGAEANFSNLETSITVCPIQTTRVHKDHPVTQIIGDLSSSTQTRSMTRMVKEQGGLTETHDEDFHTQEVYVYQPLAFEDPNYPDKVYKVVKALYGLPQALRAWYETLANYLLENGFQRGKIDQTLLIKNQKDGKSASTPIDIEKPLLKDPDGEDLNVNIYRRMHLNRGKITELDANEDVTLVDVDAKVEMDDTDEAVPDEVEEVLEVVTVAKLMTNVVTTTAPITTDAQVPKTSAPRRRRGVVIQDPEETTNKQRIDKDAKELKRQLQIIVNDDDDDIYTEATPLASKVPVVDYQIHHENNKPYYKIIRADGTHKLFLSFITLLKIFDREDLKTLWKIVKERFESIKPKNFSDYFLLNTLKIMFEKPNVEANVWRDQKGRYGLGKVKSWKLFESCGVHIITLTTTKLIFLVEKKYPLTHFILEQMLNNVRLEVEKESEISLELLRLVRRQLNEGYVPK
uniref:Retrovirus-related Pol polyprotein from transposon TNT 1-94 n=1 Tax=Tanacetum cinerariifolium TaxID=118510 RepID=A0A6L2LDA3_TANCI|nr:retrovirus-related Pol polyprotein from transposon TNT 1-94 [Tanacetum cinerariifolium]